jgi:hypothetical protein
MRSLLQSLADALWPVGPKSTAARADPDIYLRPIILLLIVVLCGPELFAAADLVSLLDLFGAVLFLTAFAVGYRVVGLTVLAQIRRILVPAELAVTIESHAHPMTVLRGVLLLSANGLRFVLSCLIVLVGAFLALRTVI